MSTGTADESTASIGQPLHGASSGTAAGLKSSATSESGFDGAFDDSLMSSASTDNASHATEAAAAAAPSSATPQPRPTVAPRGVTQASLGAGIEGLVLYDLTDKHGSTKSFSPHTIKTVLDLKLLGVGAERHCLTFAEIRTQLAARVGDNAATVPTLELADGTHLSDSWSIAQYLADRHPRGSLLFPTPSSRPFASLLNSFSKVSLAPYMGPMVRPAVHAKLDEESATYFEQVKVGKAKMDKFRNLSPDERERNIDACVNALELIQVALAGAEEQVRSQATGAPTPQQPQQPLWLEAGAHPTHADFVVYGWVVHTRAAGQGLVREIWHAHPLVSRWIQNMDAWAGPEVTADFY